MRPEPIANGTRWAQHGRARLEVAGNVQQRSAVGFGSHAAVQYDRHRPGDTGRSFGGFLFWAVAGYYTRDLYCDAASWLGAGAAICGPHQFGVSGRAAEMGVAARATGAQQPGRVSGRVKSARANERRSAGAG